MEANHSPPGLRELQSRYDHMGLILRKNLDHYEIYNKERPDRLIVMYYSLSTVAVEIEFREVLSRLFVAQHGTPVTRN